MDWGKFRRRKNSKVHSSSCVCFRVHFRYSDRFSQIFKPNQTIFIFIRSQLICICNIRVISPENSHFPKSTRSTRSTRSMRSTKIAQLSQFIQIDQLFSSPSYILTLSGRSIKFKLHNKQQIFSVYIRIDPSSTSLGGRKYFRKK